MINETLIYILLFGFLALFVYFLYRKNFKKLKVPSVCLITGGVKTGKSLLTTKLSIKDYKKRHRIWWVKTRIFKKNIEEPMYYTNTAISFRNLKGKKPHKLDKNIVQIELKHLLRQKRFNYGSVVNITESSLMADNMDFNNKVRNAQLSMFNKLFGHETKGGVLYYDTQSPLDNHYSIKRVVSTFFFIQKSVNCFLFRVAYVREFVNTDIGENNFTDDVDTTTRKVFIGRWWYKKYDRYYYSHLTDKLSNKTKKARFYNGKLVSFNDLYVALANTRSKKSREVMKNYEKNQKSI